VKAVLFVPVFHVVVTRRDAPLLANKAAARAT